MSCNYIETYARKIKSKFSKVLIAKTVVKNLEFERKDVIITYSHRRWNKNKTIYIKLLLEYLVNSENCVTFLNLALYRLEQGVKVWYLILYIAFIKLSFKQTFSDNFIFIFIIGIIIWVFVDDLLNPSPSIKSMNKLKKKLISSFNIIVLSLYQHHLEIDIIKNKKA